MRQKIEERKKENNQLKQETEQLKARIEELEYMAPIEGGPKYQEGLKSFNKCAESECYLKN